MRQRLLIPICAVAAILAGAGIASAQSNQLPTAGDTTAKQAAPAETQDASGHDAQTGRPETAKDSKTLSNDAQKGNFGNKSQTEKPAGSGSGGK